MEIPCLMKYKNTHLITIDDGILIDTQLSQYIEQCTFYFKSMDFKHMNDNLNIIKKHRNDHTIVIDRFNDIKEKGKVLDKLQEINHDYIFKYEDNDIIVAIPPETKYPVFYVINLERRTDRWNHICKLPVCTIRYDAIAMEPGHFGLSRTLKNLIQRAKDRKMKYICILEDDAKFPDDFSERFSPIFDWLKTHLSEWDIFQGGHTFTKNMSVINKDLKLLTLTGGQTTHFMIYNMSIYDKYIEWDGKDHCDLFMLNPLFRRLVTYPHISTQLESYSDLYKFNAAYDMHYNNTNALAQRVLNSTK